MKSNRVTWLVNSMGYNNDILYWGDILKKFISYFPKTEILTFKTQAFIPNTDYSVKSISEDLNKFKIRSNNKLYKLLLVVFSLYKLKIHRPELIIASEFGLSTISTILFKILYPKTRLLLLVENDPKYLSFYYNIQRTNYLTNLYRRFICNFFNIILTNNDEGFNYILSTIKCHKNKVIKVCYLTSNFKVTHTDKKKNALITFLFIGRLEKGKGIYELIEALKLLSIKELQNIRLLIVGDGAERNVLERMSKQYSLENHIVFYGSQPYKKIPYFLSKADVFVIPTLGDYRALVGFEALSAGLPIIGSIFDGASRETITEGVNGFLVNPLDINSLYKKIIWFINNKKLISRFAEASTFKARHYTTERASSNLINVCNYMMAK